MSKKRDYSHIKAQKQGKELDSNMCFFCLKVLKSNHGHHLVFFSEDGNPDVNNMITLCSKCHRGYHNGRISIEIGRF